MGAELKEPSLLLCTPNEIEMMMKGLIPSSVSVESILRGQNRFLTTVSQVLSNFMAEHFTISESA